MISLVTNLFGTRYMVFVRNLLFLIQRMSAYSKTYTALSLIQAILNTKDERDFGDPLSRWIK